MYDNLISSEFASERYKSRAGFTILELLIVIIIVGVLSAIAIPSFLNQIGKSRGSEAKTTLGILIRSQTSYRFENGTFTGDLSLLDARVPSNFYLYHRAVASPPLTEGVRMEARPLQDGLKGYGSLIQINGANFDSIICESVSIVPASTNIPNVTNVAKCPTDYSLLR